LIALFRIYYLTDPTTEQKIESKRVTCIRIHDWVEPNWVKHFLIVQSEVNKLRNKKKNVRIGKFEKLVRNLIIKSSVFFINLKLEKSNYTL
jgi:hypothetical protein